MTSTVPGDDIKRLAAEKKDLEGQLFAQKFTRRSRLKQAAFFAGLGLLTAALKLFAMRGAPGGTWHHRLLQRWVKSLKAGMAR